MVAQETIALVLAAITATATLAFAVFLSLTIHHHFGVWPALTVAALLIATTGATVLFSIGELNREQGRQERFR
jgi:hypothetical protein